MHRKNKDKRHRKGVVVLTGALMASVTISGVFASNAININGGSDIEFGQGVAETAACTSSLTTTLTPVYSGTVDRFFLKELRISGFNSPSCLASKSFAWKLYALDGSEIDFDNSVDIDMSGPLFVNGDYVYDPITLDDSWYPAEDIQKLVVMTFDQ